MKQKNNTPLLLLILFLGIAIIVLLCRQFLIKHHFDTMFLLVSDTLLFMISIVSYYLQLRTLANPNPHAFVRGVYTSMLIKLFVCMIAITFYIFTKSGEVNQPALFTAMGLYLVYTGIEVAGLMKALRKNA